MRLTHRTGRIWEGGLEPTLRNEIAVGHQNDNPTDENNDDDDDDEPIRAPRPAMAIMLLPAVFWLNYLGDHPPRCVSIFNNRDMSEKIASIITHTTESVMSNTVCNLPNH